ncbi:MAG: ATP-binding protein [Pseudomonadota bacterium]
MKSDISDESKLTKYPVLDEIEVPDNILENWQVTADLLASVANVPAALIMRVHASDVEVFVASRGIENLYPRGEKTPLDTGLYCETVMNTQHKLLVPNALEDPAWDHNPDMKLGMISYCGLPLTWPSGELFGTLCILDKQKNVFANKTQPLMERLRDSIQLSLASLYETSLARMQRDEAEREKQVSETQLRAFYELDLVGLAITSPNKGWIRTNDCLCKMLGYSEEELRTMTWTQLTHPDDLPADTEQFDQLLAGKIEGYSLEKRFISRNGEIVYTQLVVRCVRRNNTEVDYVVSMVEDISDRKQIEAELAGYRNHLEELVEARTRELEEANNKLRELDRLKSMFIASMSHELRTPLNSIIGFTGMTLQGLSGDLNDEQRDNLSRVYKAGQHLLSLITDVIDIAKIEAGRIAMTVESFSLAALVEDAVNTMKPQLTGKGLSCVLDIPAEIQMNTDRKRLLQCLLNLLSNAVKFTEAGQVKLIVREKNGIVTLAVSDTGIGIAAEDMPRLFEAFERLDTHLRLKAGGTGLGLYLTKKLASQVLKGDVSVESQLGEGSTFTLSIPKEIPALHNGASN